MVAQEPPACGNFDIDENRGSLAVRLKWFLGEARKLPLCLAGMGLFYGWAWTGLLSSSTQFLSDSSNVMLVRASWTTALVVNIALWLVLLSRKPKPIPLAANRGLIVALPTLMVVGTIISTLASGADASAWLVHLTGIAITSIGTGAMPVMWAEVYGRVSPKLATLGTIASALAGLTIYLCSIAIPGVTVRLIFMSIMPILMVVLLRKSVPLGTTRVTGHDARGADKPNVAASATLALVPVGLGIAFGLMLGAVDYFGGTQSAGAKTILIAVGGAIFMLVGAAIYSRKLDFYQFAYRAIVPVVAAGLVLLPSGSSLASAIILAGFLAFDLTTYAIIPDVSFRLNVPPLRLATYTRAVSHGGILAGILAGRLLAGNGFMSGSQLIVASLLMMWVLLVALTYTLRGVDFSSRVTGAQPAETADGDRASERVHEAAVRYGLSTREEEVLALLVQGRSLPYLQKELFISLGTAKFHVHNIYTKFDVHSRQDLLDQVNSASEPSNGRPGADSSGQILSTVSTTAPGESFFKL